MCRTWTKPSILMLMTAGILLGVAVRDAGHAEEIGILRSCSFGAFVTETDPSGLNVRSGPGIGHNVIGKLPPVAVSPDDPPIQSMVEVTVTASQNGWFKIKGARDNDALLDGQPPRPMFKGSGWISGRFLTIRSQAKVARDVASRKGKPIRLDGEEGVFDSYGFTQGTRLADCTGGWVYVINDRIGFRGWLDRICAMQETSCDGV